MPTVTFLVRYKYLSIVAMIFEIVASDSAYNADFEGFNVLLWLNLKYFSSQMSCSVFVTVNGF